MPGGPGGPCKRGNKTSLSNSLVVAESLRFSPVYQGPCRKQAKALSFICLTSTQKVQDAKPRGHEHRENFIFCLSHCCHCYKGSSILHSSTREGGVEGHQWQPTIQSWTSGIPRSLQSKLTLIHVVSKWLIYLCKNKLLETTNEWNWLVVVWACSFWEDGVKNINPRVWRNATPTQVF